MYRSVARWEKGVYGRAVLYTGGQRDCIQEGSVVIHRRVAWLWQDAIAS